MKDRPCYSKILREIQHENVSLDTILQFRNENPRTCWTELVYPDVGDSILHIAARMGEENIVTYILDYWSPKNVNVKNNDCKTPLHEAAQFSLHKIVKILLENGAEVDAIKRADWTALMLACTKTGKTAFQTIDCLLLNGASATLQNKDGWNALHLACRAGDLNIVNLLLNYYENENLNEMLTKNGRTVLHITCLHGHLTVALVLVSKYNFDVNIRDKCGNTPILDAVCGGNITLVKLLMSRGANLNAKNNAEMSCLHLAASEGLTDILTFLVQDMKMDPNLVTSNNVTALHCAARKKQNETMDILISLGANQCITDNYGRLPNDYLYL